MYLRVKVDSGPKYVLVSWIGEEASPLKKGRASVDKPELSSVVKDVSVVITTSNLRDLTEENVMNKVKAS